MRLWSLHPKYLDTRGLVALWREALLAQAVLRGQTKGYTRHPQLVRFSASTTPVRCIAVYLRAIHDEATQRGYSFDATKIARGGTIAPIPVTKGQMEYEWKHLQTKLTVRDPARLAAQKSVSRVEPHPIFHLTPGPVAEWEIVEPKRTSARTRS